MAEGSTSFNVSPDGDPFDQLMAQVRQAAEGAYDILGEMGRSRSGNVVYLARELESGSLVAMKLTRAGGDEFTLEVVKTLDGAVPGLENKCPECRSVLPDLDRFCFRCGADLSAVGFTPGVEEANQLLEAVREATAGEYEILGKMDRVEGGPVFFARDLARGKLVALRLKKDESADPSQAAYSIGETQVFRPLAAELGATQVAPAGFGLFDPNPSAVSPPFEPPVPPPAPPEPVAPEPVSGGGSGRTVGGRPPVKLIGGIAAVVLIVVVAVFAFRDDDTNGVIPVLPDTVAPPAPPPPETTAVAQPPVVEPPVTEPTEPPPAGVDSGTIVLGVPLPTGGRLTLNGRPVRGLRIRVTPGSHTLALTAAGYQPVEQRVTVREGATFVWRPALAEVQAAVPPPPPQPPPVSQTCARTWARAEWAAAFALCQKEAAAGDAAAQRLFGRLHENGNGTARNPTEAAVWFGKAAAGGDRESQERLGYLHRDGSGVPRDEAKSAMFFRQAAEGGRAAAQLELGVALEDGKGVKENDAEAAQWYQKAADQGNAQAARRLGRLYERGNGVTKSEADAAKWYRTAAERGDRDAQFMLGRFYKDGKGVPKSEADALEWFKKAAAQGHKDAQSEAKKLEKP